MNLLYISHLHPPEDAPLENMGGMQRVSMQLVSELKKRDDVELHTVIQLAPWKGINIQTAFFLLKLAFRLPGLVNKYKPDVILFSSMVTASLAYFTRKSIDVPMVTINHGHDVKMDVKVYQKFVPKVFNALDGVISVSNATRNECIKRGMEPEKGVSLPNGFDISEFKSVPEKEIARKKIEDQFSINLEGKKLLLTVGRQVKRKGHAWFINEVYSHVNPDTYFLVIGDGPEHDLILQSKENSDRKETIIIAGKQPDKTLKNAYSAADLFIMPNIPIKGDMEGFGIVLLEANLASTPAVASDLEGIKDVLTNGKNGYKVPVKDPKAFADRINQVLSEEVEDFGAKSRAYVRDKFAWTNVADEYVNYLQTVIDRYPKKN